MDAPTGPWPLSAAATVLLQNPKARSSEVLRLAVKELVLRRAWRVDRESGKSTRRRWALVLRPGDRPVPQLAPLPLVDRTLRDVVPSHGGPVAEMVRHALSLNSVDAGISDGGGGCGFDGGDGGGGDGGGGGF